METAQLGTSLFHCKRCEQSTPHTHEDLPGRPSGFAGRIQEFTGFGARKLRCETCGEVSDSTSEKNFRRFAIASVLILAAIIAVMMIVQNANS